MGLHIDAAKADFTENTKTNTDWDMHDRGRRANSHCPACCNAIGARKRFCSLACLRRYRYTEYIKAWKSGLVDGSAGGSGQVSTHIRNYLFEKHSSKCSSCGWGEINPSTGKTPLTIEHKDGNAFNNSEDNLDLLCPNCHSLTPTYGSLNRGNGRRARREYRYAERQRIHKKKAHARWHMCPVCGKNVKGKKHCSPECSHLSQRKTDRPSIEQILDDVSSMSMVAVGKKYGVSDNAVRKWLKSHNANMA